MPEQTITLADQISELKREIAIRQRVYWTWIGQKRMKVETARKAIASLKASLHVLLELRVSFVASPVEPPAKTFADLARDRLEDGGLEDFNR